MQRTHSSADRALHTALALVLGVEATGVAWQLIGGSAVGVIVSLMIGLVAFTWGIWVANAEEDDCGEELVESWERQDMRRIPRWFAGVPLAIAVLGALWLWLVLT